MGARTGECRDLAKLIFETAPKLVALVEVRGVETAMTPLGGSCICCIECLLILEILLWRLRLGSIIF
jgi:hypothetical protein